MHIPGHFVSLDVAGFTTFASIAIIAYVMRRLTREEWRGGDFYKMGLVSSFIFISQTINVPVIHGTSGHLLGGVLAAFLLGPWRAFISLSIVLTVQSVFYADGGLAALGANIFNMAAIGAVGGYYIYNRAGRLFERMFGTLGAGFSRFSALALASWASVVLAAAACSVELAASGTFPLWDSLIAMVGIHAAIGAIEILITLAAISALALYASLSASAAFFRVLNPRVLGLLGVFAIALLFTPLASPDPDGLESVAGALDERGELRALDGPQELFNSPMQDYEMPGVGDNALSALLAGVSGIAVIMAMSSAASIAHGRGVF